MPHLPARNPTEAAINHPRRQLMGGALALAALGAGCKTAPVNNAADGVALFPAVPTDKPPGASDKAKTMAKRLGPGINFGNIFDAPTDGAWGLRHADAQPLIPIAWQMGFRSVRLPVRWSNHTEATAPYRIDAAFMKKVQNAVDALLKQGFTVVMNMHHYSQLDGDKIQVGEFAVPDDVVEKRFLVIWQQVAEQFKSYPDELLFEVYNEPHGRLGIAAWNDLMALAVGQIRPSNPNRLLVIGPTQ
jgi:endoglucanase